jgi:quercetin dioxygenase-like cupin family protein
MHESHVRPTHGSDQRPARSLDEPLAHVDLREEIRRLSDEPHGNDRDRSAVTLAKLGSFRMVLTTVSAGATIGGDDTNGSLAIQVVSGAAVVSRDADETRVEPGQVAVVAEGAPWRARAESDCALLLTLSWPEGTDPAIVP